jgi:hypothetical protein
MFKLKDGESRGIVVVAAGLPEGVGGTGNAKREKGVDVLI